MPLPSFSPPPSGVLLAHTHTHTHTQTHARTHTFCAAASAIVSPPACFRSPSLFASCHMLVSHPHSSLPPSVLSPLQQAELEANKHPDPYRRKLTTDPFFLSLQCASLLFRRVTIALRNPPHPYPRSHVSYPLFPHSADRARRHKVGAQHSPVRARASLNRAFTPVPCPSRPLSHCRRRSADSHPSPRLPLPARRPCR